MTKKLQASINFEDTMGVIRSRKSKKADNTMAKGKQTRKTNDDLQIHHRLPKIKQHELR